MNKRSLSVTFLALVAGFIVHQPSYAESNVYQKPRMIELMRLLVTDEIRSYVTEDETLKTCLLKLVDDKSCMDEHMRRVAKKYASTENAPIQELLELETMDGRLYIDNYAKIVNSTSSKERKAFISSTPERFKQEKIRTQQNIFLHRVLSVNDGDLAIKYTKGNKKCSQLTKLQLSSLPELKSITLTRKLSDAYALMEKTPYILELSETYMKQRGIFYNNKPSIQTNLHNPSKPWMVKYKLMGHEHQFAIFSIDSDTKKILSVDYQDE